jgi:RNA polymerase sigma factor (sigma-70 family)
MATPSVKKVGGLFHNVHAEGVSGIAARDTIFQLSLYSSRHAFPKTGTPRTCRLYPSKRKPRGKPDTKMEKFFSSARHAGIVGGILGWLPGCPLPQALWQTRVAPLTHHSVDTVNLRSLLDRIQAGDLAAQDELLRGSCAHLERLARKMLRRFPGVHRWADTDDVLQNAVLRLLRALREIRPANTREFFGLAAVQIRRELLDLARHFFGPEGEGANHASRTALAGSSEGEWDPIDRRSDVEDLQRWCDFHQEVGGLPPEEREVVSLVFYHGWTQAQVAELCQISERTVRRRWEAALVKLHEILREDRGK